MKVTHIMRDARQGNFSIEQIFGDVRDVLSDQIEFKVYRPNRNFDLKAVFDVKKYAGEVNHITGDVNYLALGLPSENLILTVHDIGHYLNTLSGFKKKIYGQLWWNLPLKKAKIVTAISKFTADQLISNFSISASKIEIIPDPLLKHFSSSKNKKDEINMDCPVILQIGSGRNKNIERLIKAVQGVPCKLLLIRKPDAEIRRMLENRNIRYEWQYNLSQEEIVESYLRADMLFFASTYEGFGMPILEAQALGIPVITSNQEPMVEVTSNIGAIFVDPFSIKEIQNAIKLLMSNYDLVYSLQECGYRNVQKFSLYDISQDYLEIYNSVAS